MDRLLAGARKAAAFTFRAVARATATYLAVLGAAYQLLLFGAWGW